MTITAIIIADSISPEGVRLTTFQLRYPRFIHAELMTHQDFSRNASSSRAIPVAKMIEDLRRDPAMPIYWGSNKPGMQAGAELDPERIGLVASGWILAMEENIRIAETMVSLGLHKQIANRILEPWAHINVVVTATNYANFYALRRHEDAQPEIKALADAMWEAQEASTPQLLQPGEWHLPYITYEELHSHSENEAATLLRKVSVARCARVSYLTHDGRQTTVEEDLALYERLLGSQPLHASPAEHQATPDSPHPVAKAMSNHAGWEIKEDKWDNRHLWGNLRSWIQNRKTIPGERVEG